MKTYAWSSLAALFCSFLLIACSATQSQENDLQSGEWRVISMNGKNVDSDAVATLTFSSNGRLAGEAFCNNYMAGYQLVDQKLTISRIAGTKMACSPELMILEMNFHGILSDVTSYKILPDGNLLIQGAGDKKLIAHPVDR